MSYEPERRRSKRRDRRRLRDLPKRPFGIIPLSLTMLALRFALAVPFWKSGLTKWDGFLNISFGAKQLFAEEFKLHIFGAEIPYPAPELVATLSAIAEVSFPVLLVLGLGARYAALGLLGMTAIIQLTVPDGWANFHLALGVDGAGDHDFRARQDRARLRAGAGSFVARRVRPHAVSARAPVKADFNSRWRHAFPR